MTVIRVVSGLAHRQIGNVTEVLMGLRPKDKARPGLWELPGGKVEPGEDYDDALEREWREEIGIKVTVGDHITTASFELDALFVVDLYEVRSHSWLRIEPLAHETLEWVDPHEAMKMRPCSPGFYVHYAAMMRFLGVTP